MPDHDHLLVSITTSSSEEAERIAEALVQERLAACVNIVPAITSIYRWLVLQPHLCYWRF